MILAGPFAGKESVQRFRAEAEAAASLCHPNIVAIHEVGEHEGQPYFSMDYLQGRDLADVVREHPMTARRAAACIQTIAQAIQFAHDRGVLHRDLKPSNMLLDIFDAPHITDFGLAKRFTTSSDFGIPNSDLTLSGQVLGSPNYLPPEQASGKRGQVGPASDVYALGAILHHLLTGRAPFAAESVTGTLRQVLENDPVSPRLLNPTVPVDLETICLKCLQKEPAQRYATAKELGQELGRFLNSEPILARPVGLDAKTWRWCRRKPALATLGGIAVALSLVVVIGAPIALYKTNRARLEAKRAQENAQKNQLEAEKARLDTERERLNTERNLYAAEMRLASEELYDPDSGTDGGVTTLAGLASIPGSADGRGSNARFHCPNGVAVDSEDNIYVADGQNGSIRKVTPAGVVTPLAGGGQGSADGTASAARFWFPSGLAVDRAGNVYVADTGNNTIRKGYPAPRILSSDPPVALTDGKFRFSLTGSAGRMVIVEASADLVSWLPLWTNTFSFLTPLNFSEPKSGFSAKRFYRAQMP